MRRLITRNHAIRTNLRSGCANTAQSGCTRITHSRGIVIDDAITIVVQSVTRFSAWIRITIANYGASRAGRRSRSAYTKLPRIAHHGSAGVAVIDGAIAIVIKTVADFGRRGIVLIAYDRAAGTRRRARRTNTLLTGIAVRSAARIAIVDGSIAIVVQSVACFRARIRIAIAYDRAIGARCRSWSTHTGLPRVAHHGAARVAIIDGAIAIIIQSVADLGAWIRITIANDSTAGAGRRSRGAYTKLPRVAHHRTTGIAVVDNSVAIIVQAVASFGRWIVVAIAHNRAASTRRRSRRTNTWLTGIAVRAGAGIAVVDGTIAIVIEPVACFRAWIRIAIAYDGTARTRRRSRSAHTELPRVARHVAAGIAIVDSTVAIVVQPVAHFRRRLRGLAARNHSIRTNLCSCRANAIQSGRTGITHRRGSIVDRAIAIVVEPIANFGAGIHIGIANEHSVRTRSSSRRTNALLPRLA